MPVSRLLESDCEKTACAAERAIPLTRRLPRSCEGTALFHSMPHPSIPYACTITFNKDTPHENQQT